MSSTKIPGTVLVYIDNISLNSQGQKIYKERNGLNGLWDPTWRFDTGHIMDVLIESSGLGAEEKAFDVKVKLYRFSTLSGDTIYDSTRPANICITFGSGLPAQAEREADAELIADSIFEASEASHRQVPTILILVLGNRDIRYAQSMIAKNYGCQVHVWMWKSSLPGGYPQDVGDVQVHILDDIVQNLSYHGIADSHPDWAEELLEGESSRAKVEDDADYHGRRDDDSLSLERQRYRSCTQHRVQRCHWREYCHNIPGCKYGHTIQEMEQFDPRNPPLRRHRFCPNVACRRGSRCYYAHSEAELLCPTCGQSGAGHRMRACPERFCWM